MTGLLNRLAIAASLALLMAAHTVSAETVAKIKTYSISGSTVPELILAMQKSSNDGFWALTRWTWRYNYAYRRSSQKTVLENVRVSFEIVVTLPRWKERDQASDCMKASWDRMLANLEKHERKHVALVQGLDREIKKAIQSLSPLPGKLSDEALFARVKEKIDPIGQRYQAQNDAFDKKTDHGKNDPTHPVIFDECPQ